MKIFTNAILDFKNPDSDKSKWLTYQELAALYKELAEKYPIVSIEDPFAEDDWEAWAYFNASSDFQVVGYVILTPDISSTS